MLRVNKWLVYGIFLILFTYTINASPIVQSQYLGVTDDSGEIAGGDGSNWHMRAIKVTLNTSCTPSYITLNITSLVGSPPAFNITFMTDSGGVPSWNILAGTTTNLYTGLAAGLQNFTLSGFSELADTTTLWITFSATKSAANANYRHRWYSLNSGMVDKWAWIRSTVSTNWGLPAADAMSYHTFYCNTTDPAPPAPNVDTNLTIGFGNNYSVTGTSILSDVRWDVNFTGNLSSYVFGTNISGVWVNQSRVFVNQFNLSFNTSYNIYPHFVRGSYCGQLWYNSSTGENITNSSCYTVNNVVIPKFTKINLTLMLSGLEYKNVSNVTGNQGVNNERLYDGDNVTYMTLDTGKVGNFTFYMSRNNAGDLPVNLSFKVNVTLSSSPTNQFNVYCRYDAGWKVIGGDKIGSTHPQYNWQVYINYTPCFVYNDNYVLVAVQGTEDGQKYHEFNDVRWDYNTSYSNSSVVFDSFLVVENVSVLSGALVLGNLSLDEVTGSSPVLKVLNFTSRDILLNSSGALNVTVRHGLGRDLYNRYNHSFAGFSLSKYRLRLAGSVVLNYSWFGNYTYDVGLNYSGYGTAQLNFSGFRIDDFFPLNVSQYKDLGYVTCFNSTDGYYVVKNSTWVKNSSKNVVVVYYETPFGVTNLGNTSYTNGGGFLYANFTARCDGSGTAYNTLAYYYDEISPVITIQSPLIDTLSMNRSFFRLNYTVFDAQSNLFIGNFTLRYNGNGSVAKTLLTYYDLNDSRKNESLALNWSDVPYDTYYVEVCFSDELALSPVMKSYGINVKEKDVLSFVDGERQVSVDLGLVVGYYEGGKWKSKGLNKDKLGVVAEKSKDNKHIVFGGQYEGLVVGDRLRYVYKSNNKVPLRIVNASIGLVHADVGLKNVYWQHKDLLVKGWKVNTFYDKDDVVVEFWKDSYGLVEDFDPVSGGVNYACVNSNIFAKGYQGYFMAKQTVTGEVITGFTVVGYPQLYGKYVSDPVTFSQYDFLSLFYNTTTGLSTGNVSLPAGYAYNGSLFNNYTFVFSKVGYASQSVSFDVFGDFNYTFLVGNASSIFLKVYNETTLYNLTDTNVVVKLSCFEGCSAAYNSSFVVNDSSEYLIGMPSGRYVLFADADGYSQKEYSFYLASGDYIANDIYMLADGLSTNVVITVTNQDDNPVADAYLYVMRFYPANNTYKNVEILKTDSEGSTISRMQLYDTWYKFLVLNSNRVSVHSTAPSYISSNSLSIVVNTVGSYLSNWLADTKVAYGFNLNNATGVLVFTAVDTSGRVNQICWDVVNRKMTGDVTVCEECVNSSVASFVCSTDKNSTGTFIATAWVVRPDFQFHLIDLLYFGFDLDAKEAFSSTGLFIQVLLTLVLAGFSLANPVVGIFMTIMSLAIGNMLGILHLGWGTFVLLAVVGVLIMYRMRS